MYEYIKGGVAMLRPTSVVIEAAGVGYLLHISLPTYAVLEGRAEALLFTHQVIRDDARLLYGFATEAERELFRLLISVSGIGSNTACVMLSAYKASELVGHISVGNVAALKSIKGIGLKTAERVVLDLKAKVLNVMALDDNSTDNLITQTSTSREAVDALMVLGYSRVATEKAVKSVCLEMPTASVEYIIRAALQLL